MKRHIYSLILILIIISGIVPLVLAQDTEKAIAGLDCSIPFEAQNLKPGDPDTKTPVKIGFFVIDVKGIDDLEQTFTADVWFNETWNDPRLSEKALGKSLENCVYREGEIWTAQIVIINRNGGQQLLARIARVDKDSNVNIEHRYVGDLTSDLDFSNFPFDTQELHFIMAAVGPDAGNVKFELDNNS